jgi:hypothetical protein
MNTKQSNKLASYGAVEALLQATPEIVNTPGLPEKLAVLSAKVGEIHSLAKTQTQPRRAIATARDLVLDAMAEQALEIAGLITTLARDIKAPQLAEAVEVGRSSFRRARRGHRQWFAQRVLDTATAVLPQLAAYGVTAETLDAFRTRINAAQAGMAAARNAIVDKVASTRRLIGLFREVDELMNDQIDRLVFRLRKDHPGFNARYEEARAILHLRGSRREETDTEEATTPAELSVPVSPSSAVQPQAA